MPWLDHSAKDKPLPPKACGKCGGPFLPTWGMCVRCGWAPGDPPAKAEPQVLSSGAEIKRGTKKVYVQRVCRCVNGDLNGTCTIDLACQVCHGTGRCVIEEVE